MLQRCCTGDASATSILCARRILNKSKWLQHENMNNNNDADRATVQLKTHLWSESRKLPRNAETDATRYKQISGYKNRKNYKTRRSKIQLIFNLSNLIQISVYIVNLWIYKLQNIFFFFLKFVIIIFKKFKYLRYLMF